MFDQPDWYAWRPLADCADLATDALPGGLHLTEATMDKFNMILHKPYLLMVNLNLAAGTIIVAIAAMPKYQSLFTRIIRSYGWIYLSQNIFMKTWARIVFFIIGV